MHSTAGRVLSLAAHDKSVASPSTAVSLLFSTLIRFRPSGVASALKIDEATGRADNLEAGRRNDGRGIRTTGFYQLTINSVIGRGASAIT
jgi:hypothetical protein